MARYIAIEHNSGLVWGEATHESPECACSMIATEAGGSDHNVPWMRIDPIRDTDGGYHLYLCDDTDLEDCVFEAGMADLVEAHCKFVGDFRSTIRCGD